MAKPMMCIDQQLVQGLPDLGVMTSVVAEKQMVISIKNGYFDGC